MTHLWTNNRSCNYFTFALLASGISRFKNSVSTSKGRGWHPLGVLWHVHCSMSHHTSLITHLKSLHPTRVLNTHPSLELFCPELQYHAVLHCNALCRAACCKNIFRSSSAVFGEWSCFWAACKEPRGFFHLLLALCPNSVSLDQNILCPKLLLFRCFSYLMNAKTNNKIYWHHVTDG